MDYPAWIHRAERFVRRLNHLPGEWNISIAVEEPASAVEFQAIEESLHSPIPAPLRKLYTEGAAGLDCRYSWSPGPEHRKRIESLLPHEYDFGGGARWIALQELPHDPGIPGWWDFCQDSDLTEEVVEAIDIWRNAFPVIVVGNGDYVALDTRKDPDNSPVVYLCHDWKGRSVIPLASSLEKFLLDWESTGYLGPEIWLLQAFLGDEGLGPLELEKGKVDQWLSFLLNSHPGEGDVGDLR